jgi:hypothetical protein
VTTLRTPNRIRQLGGQRKYDDLRSQESGVLLTRQLDQITDKINNMVLVKTLPYPGNLTATIFSAGIQLRWDDVPNEYKASLAGTRVWRADQAIDANTEFVRNSNKRKIADLVKATFYTDLAPDIQTTYIYWVENINLDGEASLPAGGKIAATRTPPSGGLPVDTVNPDSPTIAVAKSGVNSALIGVIMPVGSPVGWLNVTRIECDVATDVAFTDIVFAGKFTGTILTEAQFTFLSAAPGQFYARARVANGYGTSNYCTAISFDTDTSAGDIAVPSAPTITLQNTADNVAIPLGSVRAKVDFSACTNKLGLWGAWIQFHTSATMTNSETTPDYSPGTRKGTIKTGGVIFTDAGAAFSGAGIDLEDIIICSYDTPWPGDPASNVFIAGIKSIDSDSQITITGVWSQPSGAYTYRICKPPWKLDSDGGFCPSLMLWDQQFQAKGYGEVDIKLPPEVDYYARAWVFNQIGRSPVSSVTGAKQSQMIPEAHLALTTRDAAARSRAGLTLTGDVSRLVPRHRIDDLTRSASGTQRGVTTPLPGSTRGEIFHDSADGEKAYRWSGPNLFTYSEQLDNAVWADAALGSSITANASGAPDGLTTADKLCEDNSNTQHYRYRIFPTFADDVDVTLSFFAKAAERTQVGAQLCTKAAAWATGFLVNLSDGTTNSPGVTVTDAGNGWYRIAYTFNISHGTVTPQFVFNVVLGDYFIYQGITGYGVYVWGMQIEVSSFVHDYDKTEAEAHGTWDAVQDSGATRARAGLDASGDLARDILNTRKIAGRSETLATTLGRLGADGKLLTADDVGADGTVYGRPTLNQVTGGGRGYSALDDSGYIKNTTKITGRAEALLTTVSRLTAAGALTNADDVAADGSTYHRLTAARNGVVGAYQTPSAPNGTIDSVCHYVILESGDLSSADLGIFWKYTQGTQAASQFIITLSDGTATFVYRVAALATAATVQKNYRLTIYRCKRTKPMTATIAVEYVGSTGIAVSGLTSPLDWSAMVLTSTGGSTYSSIVNVDFIDWAGGNVWFDTDQYRNDLAPTNGVTGTIIETLLYSGGGAARIELASLAYSQGANIATHLAVIIKSPTGTLSLTGDMIVCLLNLAALPSTFVVPVLLDISNASHCIGVAAVALTKNGYAFNGTFWSHSYTPPDGVGGAISIFSSTTPGVPGVVKLGNNLFDGRYPCNISAYGSFACLENFSVASGKETKFGTHSALGAETLSGFITIKDAAGNARKLAVVS